MATDLKEGKEEKYGGSNLFKPGQSGNPAGRPVGARGKATAIIEALEKEMGKTDVADNIAEIFLTVIDQGKSGCLKSQQMLLDRFAPIKLFEEGSGNKTPIVNITINGTEAPEIKVIEDGAE